MKVSWSKEVLANGLEILRVPMVGVESVSSVVFAKTGSRYEEQREYGLAHFFEHMVFKGTRLYPDTKTLSETVDSMGALFNAFTSEEATAFYIKSASKDVDLSLKVLGQLVTEAKLEQEEIEKERGVILEEMHMYEDQPASYNAILFNEMFYQGNGVAHNILGEKEIVKSFNRDNFVNFRNKFYGPANMLVVLAGKASVVESSEWGKKIEEYFSFAPGVASKFSQEKTWQSDYQYQSRISFNEKATEQIHFILGWPGINHFDKRDNALALLSTIVGGNMSSRLFLQVREKRGLCYYVNSINDNYADVGLFGASAGVNPEKLIEAIKVTKEQFLNLGQGREIVNKEELEKAKNYYVGQMILAQESTHGLALSYGLKRLLEDKIITIEEKLAELMAVTLEEVREVAKELIVDQPMSLGLIGGVGEKERAEIEKIVREK